MSRTTAFLARLLGLLLVIISLAMLLNPGGMGQAMTELVHEPVALLLFSLLALSAGLAIVLTHNVWTGGAVTVVVSLLGWLFVFRGVVLLLLPSETLVSLFDALGVVANIRLFAIGPLMIGLWLAWAGFRQERA